jgi:hypothetical protein
MFQDAEDDEPPLKVRRRLIIKTPRSETVYPEPVRVPEPPQPEADVEMEPPDLPEPEKAEEFSLPSKIDITSKDRVAAMALLHRIHRNMGHCSNQVLTRILQDAKVSPVLVELSKELNCEVCQSHRHPETSMPSAVHDPASTGIIPPSS